MKKIFVLLDLFNQNSFEFEKKNLISLSKYLEEIIIINVGIIAKSKYFEYEKVLNKKFKILNPKDINELKKIFQTADYPILKCTGLNYKFFKINFLLAKIKNKKFVISNLGYQPHNFNYEGQKFKNNIMYFFKERISYYLNRILILFNFYPKIDYFFESSEYIINSVNNSLSAKIKKLKLGIDISYYKKIIKINSRTWDNHFYQKFDFGNEYIVFVDGMIFDHPDRISREGPANLEDRNKYYKNINKILSLLSNKFNKEIIICLHPKNNISATNKDFNQFKCVKYKTDEYINKSFIVLFHEGSSIIEAVLLKKKIINFDGKSLGPYINKRSKLYCDLLKLKRINFDSFDTELEQLKLSDLEKRTNSYDSYINKNIVFDKKQSGIQQVINFLNKNYE